LNAKPEKNAQNIPSLEAKGMGMKEEDFKGAYLLSAFKDGLYWP